MRCNSKVMVGVLLLGLLLAGLGPLAGTPTAGTIPRWTAQEQASWGLGGSSLLPQPRFPVDKPPIGISPAEASQSRIPGMNSLLMLRIFIYNADYGHLSNIVPCSASLISDRGQLFVATAIHCTREWYSWERYEFDVGENRNLSLPVGLDLVWQGDGYDVALLKPWAGKSIPVTPLPVCATLPQPGDEYYGLGLAASSVSDPLAAQTAYITLTDLFWHGQLQEGIRDASAVVKLITPRQLWHIWDHILLGYGTGWPGSSGGPVVDAQRKCIFAIHSGHADADLGIFSPLRDALDLYWSEQ